MNFCARRAETNTVSTLLEILRPGCRVLHAGEFVFLFQPFLRFYVKALLVRFRAARLVEFQPFLRFYRGARGGGAAGRRGEVSTLLEILHATP